MARRQMTKAERREYDQKHFEEWGITYFDPPLKGVVVDWILDYYKCEILGLVKKNDQKMVRVRILPGSKGGDTRQFKNYRISQHLPEHYISEGDVPFSSVYVDGQKLTMEIYERIRKEAENAEAKT